MRTMNINAGNLTLVATQGPSVDGVAWLDFNLIDGALVASVKITADMTQAAFENVARKQGGKFIEKERQARWKEQQAERDERRYRYEKNTGRGKFSLGALGLV